MSRRTPTATGGRQATTRHIAGDFALSVGMPAMKAPTGWEWIKLTDVARLESGHTPSRKHPEYWGGDIPWIGIRDAKANHGTVINATAETTNQLGIANSSARVLPAGTVCLSRTASVGYVVVMGRPMATSQDFVSWVCSEKLAPRFLAYLLITEKDSLRRFSSGAVHQTIYFPEAKAFHVCIPLRHEQERLVAILDEAFEGIGRAIANAERNLANAGALFDSYLNAIFTSKGGDWAENEIGRFAEIFDGPHATPKTVETGPIFLGISALQDGAIRLEKTRHVTEEDFKRWTRRVKPQADDVVFSYETRLGQAAIIPEGLECCLGRRMGLVRLDQAVVDPRFFVYQYISLPYRRFLAGRTICGATVDRILLKEFPTFLFSYPPLAEQQRIVSGIVGLADRVRKLVATHQKKLDDLCELKQSLLQKAFGGELAAKSILVSAAACADQDKFDTKSPKFAANVIALVYDSHTRHRRERTFGHVKAQKALHLVESLGGLDLGRRPTKDAAGPNDFPHMLAAEEWAMAEQFFQFVRRGDGYDFKKLPRYQEMLSKARVAAKPHRQELERVATILTPMNSKEAEIFATVHAAWNNLIRDNASTDDGSIIREARENWHPSKKKISEAEFRKAIRSIRDKGLVPDGTAKHVGGQGTLL